MAEKVLVRINDDAYVEENGKQIIGEYECTTTEAERLVNKLNVATLAKRVVTKSELPGEDWTNNEIKSWLDAPERAVKYNGNASKKELLEAAAKFLEEKKEK